jgi:hypothetical protein
MALAMAVKPARKQGSRARTMVADTISLVGLKLMEVRKYLRTQEENQLAQTNE